MADGVALSTGILAALEDQEVTAARAAKLQADAEPFAEGETRPKSSGCELLRELRAPGQTAGMSTVLPLPEGGRLLHIGPFKTGSTTLQAAFHQNRPLLAEQGVHYAGKNVQPMNAAMVADDRQDDRDRVTGGARPVERLLEELHAAPEPLEMISSEIFCEADDANIRSILNRLDRARTGVVLTLWPLAKILASQRQQYMRNRMVVDYPSWLDATTSSCTAGPPKPAGTGSPSWSSTSPTG